MRSLEIVHPSLPPLRLTGRNKYTGPYCPVCNTEGDNRFIVWMEDASGEVPKGRYLCNRCQAKGRLEQLVRHLQPSSFPVAATTRRTRHHQQLPDRAEPRVEHIAAYRELYELTMLWACSWLDESNPDPLAFIATRGLSRSDAQHAMVGYGLNDPQSLLSFLRDTRPDLMDYIEAAGLAVRLHSGTLETHWNLRGTLVFPTIINGMVVDLRTRKPVPGTNAKSLPGRPELRGAVFPNGLDDLDSVDTVVLTESSEFKTLVPNAAYRRGDVTYPTIGQPGLQHFRPEWGPLLRERGITTVIIMYDNNLRSTGKLRGEEIASVQHGVQLLAAGLDVRVARLPLAPGQQKIDLDAYLLEHGPRALQQVADDAVPLADYYASLPRSMCHTANLKPPLDYPVQRGRPQLLDAARAARLAPPPAQVICSLTDERTAMRTAAHDHAMQIDDTEFLVLAQPPGSGKGTATTYGLRDYERHHPKPKTIVWTAIRKDQHGDQDATLLDLIPLHGRNVGNCRRVGDANTLAAKGYSVKDALCVHRCQFANRCTYLQQFSQEGNFFAPLPLLQATGWWADAGVIVLDEFDPARLTRIIQLSSADLAAMFNATRDSDGQAVLRWLAQVCGATVDSRISGVLLIHALEAAARGDGLDLVSSVNAALAALPPVDVESVIPSLSNAATSLDFQSLPPSFLRPILAQFAKELRQRLCGQRWTSRLEIANGQFFLYQITHLRDHLCNPDQKKIILDATVNPALLHALFPGAKMTFHQPAISQNMRVIQRIGRDYTKTSLRHDPQRRQRWYDDVAAQLRPGRKTLVVCALECETQLREALAVRGCADVEVAHYGGLRGSNAYKSYDVILAQVYNPNIESLIREGRALFADNLLPLDERVISADRVLRDATGRAYTVPIVTFADERLAALLELRREAEMVQCAFRGRPLDHDDAQITILCSLPLVGLAPTIILERPATPESNTGRSQAAVGAILAAAQQALARGSKLLDVAHLKRISACSVVTIRKHLNFIANRLHLRLIERTRRQAMPRGGQRAYRRSVLAVRGRYVPPAQRSIPARVTAASVPADPIACTSDLMMDHARNHESLPRVIHHRIASFCRKRRSIFTAAPRARPAGAAPPAGSTVDVLTAVTAAMG